jgi:hypothetical protein
LGTTALTGGIIVADGGAVIRASGVCWSKTNSLPTIADDTLKIGVTSGTFSATLKNLSPSSTYYVRAYATNREGTGYGVTLTFVTGNGAPVATGVAISGNSVADALLTGNYTYGDAENNPEQGSTFQWYVSNDALGAGEAAIVGATAKTFRVQDAQQGKYIRFGVTPKAATGTLIGVEVKSAFIGAVGEGNTVTFTYNGAEVTYGILLSAKTGKKWLDRNLGATRVAEKLDDYLAYGDIYQWGRGADGHQIVTRSGPNVADMIGVNGITSQVEPYETSDKNSPNTNKFIFVRGTILDWRIPQFDGLWQGVNGINNPCPAGWRIPTTTEWVAEGLASKDDAFSKLKLTLAGQRTNRGIFQSAGMWGVYWSSTSVEPAPGTISSGQLYFDETLILPTNHNARGNGASCRCIKN